MTHAQPRFDFVQCLSPAGLHRVAWTEWGARDNPRVVVCAHGLTRSGRDFDVLAQALCGDYRVICPDMAGRGRSDWLADAKHYVVPQYVADSVTLLARLGATQVDWVGTSMGGLIGMALAALPASGRPAPHLAGAGGAAGGPAHQNPIRKLVLNDIGPVLERAAVSRIGSYVGRGERFASFAEGAAFLRKLHASFGPHTDDQWDALCRGVLVEENAAWTTHYDPRLREALGAPSGAGVSDGADAWKLYDAITCPTLAIRGEESELLNRDIHREMGQRGPKARLATVPGVGHAPTLIDPEQVGWIKDFLLR